MRRIGMVVVGIAASAAVIASTAGARTASASGDKCTASGSGTTYTLHIAIPSGARQFGFAFGAPGVTVTSAVIPGANGNFSTQGLAANTSGAWIGDTPLTGAPVVSLTTNGTATGSLVVVPAGASQSTYFSPVRCTVSNAATAPAAVFAVDPHVTYNTTAGLWQMVVSIPGAGTVSAAQLEPTTGAGSAKPVTAKSAIQVKRIALKSAGKVTLTLRPTAEGQVELRAHGSIKLQLHVAFDSSAGTSGSKVIALTLRK